MKRGISVIALGLVSAGTGWGLDTNSQRMADGYLEILQKNPVGSPVVERLYSIYRDADEEGVLLAWSRQNAASNPVVSARILVRAGHDDEALAILRAAAPGSPAAAEMLAASLESQGEFVAAMAAIELGLGQAASPGLHFRLGELALRAGDEKKAQAAWERVAALAPGDASLQKKIAVAYARAGDFIRASAQAKALASPGDRLVIWEEISQVLARRHAFLEAIEAQESLLALMGPGHWKRASAQQRLFGLHESAGTLENLREAWRTAADQHPHAAEAALRMASLEEFFKNSSERLKWLRQAGDSLPRDDGLAVVAAALALSLGQLDVAAVEADRALALRPEDEDTIFLRAEIFALQGEPEEAEKRITELLARRKEDPAIVTRAEIFFWRLRLTAPLERQLTEYFNARRGEVEAAVELARFYLDQQRFAEAVAVFSRFDLKSLPPSEAAMVASQFSQILRESGLRPEALAWARSAWTAVPENADAALVLADLLKIDGEREAARDVLEAACAAAPGLPREDLDRRAFLALQEVDEAREEGEENILPESGVLIRERLAALDHAARADAGRETDWLRLSRWLGWQGDIQAAAETLRVGLIRHPESLAIRNPLADSLDAAGQTDAALTELRALVLLQPDQARKIQQRIGKIQLDNDRLEEGLAIFSELATAEPGDWQARADLALAEQRAGNWFRAMETWKQAWERASPEARPGILPSFLNAATRLQRHEEVLDFFAQAIVAESQPARREDLLREATRYASRHGGSESWRSRLVTHSEEAPEDALWRLGLVWLLDEEGRPEEAQARLAEIPADAVTAAALLAAAESAGHWSEAARLLERQILERDGEDPALALTRAGYLQRAGEWERARIAWESISRRYARHPDALVAVAKFYERIGDEAQREKFERTAAELGGCPPEVLFRLGQRALERGDRIQALADFEAVLARSSPDPFPVRKFLPLPERVLQSQEPIATAAVVSFLPSGARTSVHAPEPWHRAVASDPEGCRLLAIQEIGRLLTNRPDKASWIDGFSLPLEQIWAAYSAGDIDRALTGLEKMADAEDASRAVGQIFAALALEQNSQAETRLPRWANDDPIERSKRWDNVVEAFSRLVQAGWEPTDQVCQEVFRSAPALKRWQVARVLAAQNHFRIACLLGESVPEDMSPTQAAAALYEISRWWVALRNAPRSILCLDRAIVIAPPAVGYDNVLFAALRARWLLTLPDDRAKFEEGLAPIWKSGGRPASEAAARALLAALADRPVDAATQLGQVFSHREEMGDWDRAQEIQRGGGRLEEWNLPRFARDLYRQELGLDSVLSSRTGGNFHSAIESLLISNQIGNAPGETVSYLVNEWMARGLADEELLHATMRLQQSGHSEASPQVFARLCQRAPRNIQVVIGIVNLAMTPDYTQVARPFLEGLLATKDWVAPPEVKLGAALRLAGLLEQEGEIGRSLALLERLDDAPEPLPGVTLPRVQILLRMGKFQEALAVLKREMTRSPVPQAGLLRPLVELSVGFGQEGEARAWLEKFPSIPAAERAAAEARLRELLSETLSPSMPAPPSPRIPSGDDWSENLLALDYAAEEPEDRFALGRKFLLDHRDVSETLRLEELQRLEMISGRKDSLRPQYYLLRKNLARSPEEIQIFTDEMRGEWDGGRGSYLAGEILIQLLLQEKSSEELTTILAEFFTDRHFNETAWDQIGRQLLNTDRPLLAARAFSALLTRRPGNSARALLLAEALGKSDRQAVGREIAAPIRRFAALNPQWHLDLARYDLAVDDLPSAREELLAADAFFRGTIQAAQLWARLAEEDLEMSRFDEARQDILRAMECPQFRPSTALVAYYEATGELETLDPASNSFELRPGPLADWKIEMAQRLLATGKRERASVWIESEPVPVADPRWRNLLRQLARSDPARVDGWWEIALQYPSWDIRVEAAEFFRQRAQYAASPEAARSDFARAHDLHPGSFVIARPYVEALLDLGDPVGARAVLREVMAAYALPADRRAAQELLANLEASPALPRGG